MTKGVGGMTEVFDWVEGSAQEEPAGAAAQVSCESCGAPQTLLSGAGQGRIMCPGCVEGLLGPKPKIDKSTRMRGRHGAIAKALAEKRQRP